MTRWMNLAARMMVTLALGGCTTGELAHDDEVHAHDETSGHAHGAAESWAVTSWGERFEIFAEADPLVVGRPSRSHTHVTALADFSPLREGVVSAVLRGPGGEEHVFAQDQALRDGIFDVEIVPPATGEYELMFRVRTGKSSESVPSGRVIVGDSHSPGGLVDADDEGGSAEEVPFLKEEQWKTRFATDWVQRGRIRDGARGTGRVRPAAGGQQHLAAPIDGLVAAEPWPFVGMRCTAGNAVLALSPRVSQGRTLAELEAVDTQRRTELELAQERLARLERLLEVGAVSSAEVRTARARTQTLRAQSEAARRQVASVNNGRDTSTPHSPLLEISSPFNSEVAEVLVSAGQAVTAGDPLVRMVRVEPVWLEVHLSPGDAQQLRSGVSGLWVRTTGDRTRTLFAGDQASLVSIAPEVSARTGRVTCLLEVDTQVSKLPLGSVVEAEVLLANAREGIVVPSAAIVDDAGVPTVFVQLDGETFERREVSVIAREGDHLLIDGLRVDERLVTFGGAAIRRASLVSSGGANHGHVH